MMKETWTALVCVALMAIAVSGCGGPTLNANGTEARGEGVHDAMYVAEFVDEHGAFMVHVNVMRRVRVRGADGMTEVKLEVAHQEGTMLESLVAEFRSGLVTPVYLEPSNYWLDGMEFLAQEGVATLRVPELDDVHGRGTVVYTFLVPTQALAESAGGLPLAVTFSLNGTKQTAEFTLSAPGEPEAIAIEGSGE